GTHQGQVTVTYPDGSQEVIDVTVTVEEQPQSDTHNPVVRDDEIVGYGEEIDWRDVIDNIDDLPPGTTVTETSENPIDTTVPGTHQGQVTVTYPDGSQEVIDVTVTVEEQPQSDTHNPVVRDDEIVGYGEEIDWRDVIDNIDDLPPGTTVTETSENPIDTTVPGTHQGQVTVTYPDGSQEVIDVTVTVEEQPQSDRYNPVIGSETVEYGKEIEWKDVVENMEDLPEGTTVTDTSAQPLDTTVPGTYIREITITYPDGSTEVMEVEVTVKEDSGQAPSPTPGPDTEEETPEEVKEESWSLVSVISTVFSALAMLIQFLIKSVKVDDSGAHFVRNKIFKLITAVLAVVAIVYLFSTNNLSLTMRMVNETTPVSAIMTVATTTSLILGMRWKPSKK
ncbi:MAG TPA: Rib/alpha-like domain-containing protein, partial [Clostridia bacterium]|nr:Rib/alpha-like domain-containing protein [Clostridia bacterium]